jgi:hypothetical protein
MAVTMAACGADAPDRSLETESPPLATEAPHSYGAPSAAVMLRAKQHLASFRGFEGASVAAWHPMLDGDGGVAYWEAELTRDGDSPAGYLILGADRRDRPLIEFSPGGKSHHREFADKLKDKPFRMMRFGPTWVAAVGEDGALLDGIGEQPTLLPDECVLAGRFEERVDDGVKVTATGRPEKPASCKSVPKASFTELVRQYRRFQPSATDTHAREQIERAWDALEAHVNAPEPEVESLTLLGPSPSKSYSYSFAKGYDYSAATDINTKYSSTGQNITYYLQMPPLTATNTTGNYSGCGPNAWSNYFGWWDLHGRPGAVAVPAKFNAWGTGGWTTACGDTSYWAFNQTFPQMVVNSMEMVLNDDLSVHGLATDCAGYTYNWDVWQGLDYITDTMRYEPSYWTRYSEQADADWLAAVAHDALPRGIPVVVNYSSDGHITVAYGLAWASDQTTPNDNWLWINPHWDQDERRSKWINQTDLIGVYEVYALRYVRDSGFESADDTSASPGWNTSSTNPWSSSGNAAFGIEHNAGTAYSGSNNAVMTGWFSTGYSEIKQQLRLGPDRRYTVTAMIKSGALPAGSWGRVGLKTPGGTLLTYSNFTSVGTYTKFTFNYSTGGSNTSQPVVFVGLNSDGALDVNRWIRVDDVNVYLADNVADGDFELQQSTQVDFPWSARGVNGAAFSGVSVAATDALSGHQYAWLNTPSCGSCTSNVNVLSQLISVSPNSHPGTANYRITAWVRTDGANVLMGAIPAYNTYPMSGDYGGFIPRVQSFSIPSVHTWTKITKDFDSGSFDTLRLVIGSDYSGKSEINVDYVQVQAL